MRNTHSQRLERWMGAAEVDRISRSMLGWYGPPIAIANVPGLVYACGDGDFCGPIKGGHFGNLTDYTMQKARRIWRELPQTGEAWTRRQASTMNAGFASLADLISEMKFGGKRQDVQFQKTGSGSTNPAMFSFWKTAGLPGTGAAAAAAPGGTVPTSLSAGAPWFRNAQGTDSLWLLGAEAGANNTSPCSLFVYDRLFAVAKTMSSTTAEAVTGVPTRYQNTASLNADDAAYGNFVFVEVTTALGATAHNWVTCQYTSHDGTTGLSMPSFAGLASAQAGFMDTATTPAPGPRTWFMPLKSGDRGIKALTQMQCDASVTGAVDFVIGHPLTWIAAPAANLAIIVDGIASAFNLVRVFDDACLAFAETFRNDGGTYTWSANLTLGSG